MKDVIVYSHLMKTAGSALLQSMVQSYGRKILYINRGSRIKDMNYDNKCLERDLKIKKDKTKIVFGHCFRPHLNFNIPHYNFKWVTFLREPESRYLSHFYHTYYFTSNQFNKRRYNSMKEINIEEWEKIDHNSNYQCKFISGEANAQKAIDILETKFEWVGITEAMENGVDSLKAYFDLKEFYFQNKSTNKGLADKTEKEMMRNNYADFIAHMNLEDKKLYDYVKQNIWPRYKDVKTDIENKYKPNLIKMNYNTLTFHIDSQLNFNKAKISKNNILRFYKRWVK